jgi:hypothetical protein
MSQSATQGIRVPLWETCMLTSTRIQGQGVDRHPDAQWYFPFSFVQSDFLGMF